MIEWLKNNKTEWIKKLGTYRYCFLVILVGTMLLLFPSGEKTNELKVDAGEIVQELYDLEVFEKKLEQILSQIKGAGNVKVILSLDSGSKKIIAQNQERDSEGGGSSSAVTVGRGTGGQSVVPLQTVAPDFRGALIVCPGGDDALVRLELARAVSALTGLGVDCISVCAGNL